MGGRHHPAAGNQGAAAESLVVSGQPEPLQLPAQGPELRLPGEHGQPRVLVPSRQLAAHDLTGRAQDAAAAGRLLLRAGKALLQRGGRPVQADLGRGLQEACTL